MTEALFSNPGKIRNPRGSGDEKYIQLDRWNRYMLPHPETGSSMSWTRVTTMVKKLDDTYHLTQWEKRLVAYGMALRPDLVVQAASYSVDQLDDSNVKKDLDGIAKDAKESAGGSKGSRLGTGLHNFTDRYDSGERGFFVPPPFDRHMGAYVALLEKHRVRAVPGFIERVVVVPEFNLAGKFDRFVEVQGVTDRLFVGDLKTQKTMDFGNNLTIAMQLAAYAYAPWIWDVHAEVYVPPPNVDKTVAYVFWVPAAQRTDQPPVAELWAVNLELGYRYLQLARDVDAARKNDEVSWRVDRPLFEALSGATEPDPRIEKGLDLIKSTKNREELLALTEQIKTHYWAIELENAAMAQWDLLDTPF